MGDEIRAMPLPNDAGWRKAAAVSADHGDGDDLLIDLGGIGADDN